jgi:hypothetical protein
LSVIYPEHKWQPYSFSKPHQALSPTTSKAQIKLFNIVKDLFKDHIVYMNHAMLEPRFTKTKRMEYDVRFTIEYANSLDIYSVFVVGI